MSDIAQLIPNCIPANPDVAGIGIRVGIYVQVFTSFAVTLFALRDGRISRTEASTGWTQTSAIILTGFALLLSATIQAKTYGMSTYHAIIILNIGWVNLTGTILHLVLLVKRMADDDFRWREIKSCVLVIWFSLVQLTLLNAFGIWFWATVDTFGSKAQCAPRLPVPLRILGHNILLTDPAARKAFISLHCVGFAGGVLMVMFGLAGFILLIIRPLLKLFSLPRSPYTFIFIIVLSAVDVAIIADTEIMIRKGMAFVQPGESQWTFGQTLTMFLLVPSLIGAHQAWIEGEREDKEAIKAKERREKEREGMRVRERLLYRRQIQMQWKRQKQRQKQRQRQSEKQRRKRDLMESASSDYDDDVEAQMYEEGAREEKKEMMDQDAFGNVSLST